MKVKLKLKKQLERFLFEYPKSKEYGGFLFKNNRGVISFFLPIPNMSDNPEHRYALPSNAKELATKLADIKRMSVSAMWHSHPSPCIMSVADVAYAGSNCQYMYFVMITPKTQWGRDFVWYACYGTKPEEIKIVK